MHPIRPPWTAPALALGILLAVLGSPALRSASAGEDPGRGGDRSWVVEALRDLAATEPARRAAAARLLGGAFPEGACGTPLLEVGLQDEDPAVREACRAAIVGLAREGAEALVAFLRNVDEPQNRAFRAARDLVRRLGARVTPWDLDAVAGRDARAVFYCLEPQPFEELAETVRLLKREILASEAGTFVRPGEALLPLVERRLSCAALALLGLAALPPHSLPSLPAGLLELAAHPDDGIRWGGVRLLAVLQVDSEPARAILGRVPAALRGEPLGARLGETSVEDLVSAIPAAGQPVDNLALSLARDPIHELGRRGAGARAALPRLEALFRLLLGAAGPDELESYRQKARSWLASALCRIDGATDERVQVLLEGLGAVGDAGSPKAAVEGLRACAESIPAGAVRRRVAERVAVLLAHDDIDLRETALSVLDRLGPDAEPASLALAAVIPWTGTWLAEHLGGAPDGRPGSRKGHYEAFLALGVECWEFAQVVALRHRAAALLRTLPPAPVRATLAPFLEAEDPLLRCEVAAVLRRPGT